MTGEQIGILIFILSWPALLLCYWLFLRLGSPKAVRKVMNVTHDMDAVEAEHRRLTGDDGPQRK